MTPKEIRKEIKKLEKSLEKLFLDLSHEKVFSNKTKIYTKEEKESLKNTWKKIIIQFKKLKKLIKRSKYNSFIFRVNYEKFVIKHYLVVFYYNSLIRLENIVGDKWEFIRQYLDDNFKENFSSLSKFIYRPDFIYLINYPSIFLELLRDDISEEFHCMIEYDNIKIAEVWRINLDYQSLFYWIKHRINKFLFNISKTLASWISHIKFTTRKEGLIKRDLLEKYLENAKSGDIILTRYNWQATNISIPGFWKHMSMYIGKGEFLRKNYSYKSLGNLIDGEDYIIEATGKWVKINTLENLRKNNDYMWVVRTDFSGEKIHRVIKNTIDLLGSQYDYLFNYYSDKGMVCSELITKAYLKEFESDEWLDIELENIWIGLTYPPNSLVKKMYLEWKDNHLENIFFIDSIEKDRSNFISTSEEFLETRNRSRFSFWLD